MSRGQLALDRRAILNLLERGGWTPQQQILLQVGEITTAAFSSLINDRIIVHKVEGSLNFYGIKLSPELIEEKLGLEHNDAVKVLEGSCVTSEEFNADPEAAWTRMRGAAEELCDHQFEPGVNEEGELEEPPYDVCIHCGDRRD
jgi:hypothetical protein